MQREESFVLHCGRSIDCELYYSEHAVAAETTSAPHYGLQLFDIVSRTFDIIIGTVGLIISLPILVLFGILIKIEDGGPVFYTQERVGLYGRHFTVYKLRSMRVDAEQNGAQWAEVEDSRVTKVGRFARKTRVDELPQFLNVLRGQMTLVGPRPERPEFVIKFDQETSGFVERLQVKPGLTGWAQINGGYDITPEEKLALDLYYIENRSPLMDLKILARTIPVILTGRGAR